MPCVTGEPLTYDQHRAGVSYFRDLIFSDQTPGARDRQERHNAEMRVINAERDERAWRTIREGDFEYRVEPSTTPGYGGNFTPPAWLNQYFATGKRPSRVLGGLCNQVPLPAGVSSINLPIIGQGSTVLPIAENAGVPSSDITDTAGSSTVVTLSGQVDASLQALEQSPVGAHLDVSFSLDLAEAVDADLEVQLVAGTGSTQNQLIGVTALSGTNSITYTDASPTGSEMYPYFGQAVGQLADGRRQPPQCWLMRSARWGWIATQEDTAGLPFGLSPNFFGSDPTMPDPVGGLLGFPVFLDEAIPATLGAGQDQDQVLLLRPSDLILLEGQPQLVVDREVLSGDLGVRIQLHRYAAAITNRYPTGIATVAGTGFVVSENF